MAKKKKPKIKRTDWSDEEHVQMLIDQRKYMWNKDYVELLAKLIGLKPGKTIADIGCGLGHLGHLYARFIKPSGSYFGIDINPKLLKLARKAAARQRIAKLARFVQGSALHIPLEDNSVDVVMCQLVLMHIKEAETAIKEMIRIAKVGGKVVAFESSWQKGSRWTNLPQQSFSHQLEDIAFSHRCWEGRKKLGYGDVKIGERLPYLFAKHGLKNVEMRLKDKVILDLIPPYSTPKDRHQSKELLEFWKNEHKMTRGQKRKEYILYKRLYVAGGGDPKSFSRIIRRQRRWLEKNYQRMKRMIKQEKLFYVYTYPFYVVIGEK